MKSDKSDNESRCDARIIGEVIRELGGGWITRDSAIDYDVGVDRIAKPGERVEKSGLLCRLHAANSAEAKSAVVSVNAAFEVLAKRPPPRPLVGEIISR